MSLAAFDDDRLELDRRRAERHGERLAPQDRRGVDGVEELDVDHVVQVGGEADRVRDPGAIQGHIRCTRG
jgi:hypothetical protein